MYIKAETLVFDIADFDTAIIVDITKEEEREETVGKFFKRTKTIKEKLDGRQLTVNLKGKNGIITTTYTDEGAKRLDKTLESILKQANKYEESNKKKEK